MDLLADLRSEIKQRNLPAGGWANGASTRAAIEATCYGLLALREDRNSAREKALDLLMRTQNADGSWSAFEGDDPDGCWATSLAAITLRFSESRSEPIEKALRWLLKSKGRELIGSGIGNFDLLIAECSSIPISTDGHGFLEP